MAADPFLIITSIIISIVLIIGIAMSIVYMQHPDDKNTAWLPKIIVVLGLFVACANVLILPFDVVNAQSGGDLNMSLLWTISFYLTAAFVLFIIPFAYFYYENERDSTQSSAGCFGLIPYWNSQLCEGIKWAVAFFIAFALILVIMYLIIPFAYIPVVIRIYSWNPEQLPSLRTENGFVPNNIYSQLNVQCQTSRLTFEDCYKYTTTIEVQVTFPVYSMALLAFLGWFLFVVFAGMGLPALPWDLFNDWRFRPKPMDLSKYAEEKRKIGERAVMLKKTGEMIKDDELNNLGGKLSRKEKRDISQTMHRFEAAVFLLKRDYYHLQVSYRQRGGNPIVYWLKLFFSIIGASMSLMWLVHICIFILPTQPIHPFLNNLFMELSIPGFPLAGVWAFCCYSFWLLLCVVKGNFRFGLRVACCRVFPMEFHNTLMNSFLANTWLILISSIVVVQFCALAFPVYARNTQIDLLFGTQIRFLQFFKYFFDNNVFIWTLLAFVVIACCWLFLCPKNESTRLEKELATIMKGKKKIDKRALDLVSTKN
eukprot:755726_1